MFYRVQGVSLGSALRLGLFLGWLVALLPAMGMAWLAVIAVEQAGALLGQVTPYELSFLGQSVASLDPLALLGLGETAATVETLAAQGGALFWSLTAGLTLLGGVGVALTTVVVALCYNLLASIGGGLRIELREVELRRIG